MGIDIHESWRNAMKSNIRNTAQKDGVSLTRRLSLSAQRL